MTRGAREWRRAFLVTLAGAYGLGLLCAFILIPATNIPWFWGTAFPAVAGADLLWISWGLAGRAREVLPWLAIPFTLWGFAAHLGALDRWIKPLTGLHILLLLMVLGVGGAAGAGYAWVRSSGVVPLGEFPD